MGDKLLAIRFYTLFRSTGDKAQRGREGKHYILRRDPAGTCSVSHIVQRPSHLVVEKTEQVKTDTHILYHPISSGLFILLSKYLLTIIIRGNI